MSTIGQTGQGPLAGDAGAVPPRDGGLKKKSARASLIVLAGFGTAQLIRFASNVVLTYLLPLSAFGLMSLVSTLLKGANMFSDAGLSGSVTRSDRGDDPVFLRTAWSLQVLRGLTVAALCAALAWPYASFYGEAVLIPLILIAAISPLFQGLSSVGLLSLRRHMHVGRANAMEILSAITSTGAIIGVALVQIAVVGQANVFAIVIGSAIGGAMYAVWSYLITRTKPIAPAWEREAVREQVAFGKWIFVTSALTFIAMQSDKLILGKIVTLEEIGLYGLALGFVRIGKDVMQRISKQVLFPAISKRKDLERAQLRRKLAKASGKMMLAMAGGLAVIAAFGDIAIEAMYPERAEPVGWMFSILSAGLIIRWVQMMTGPALMALGDPSWNAWGSVGRFVAVAIGIVVGHQMYGMPGVIVAMALADVPNYISVQVGAMKHGLSNLRRDAMVFAVFVLALAVLVLGRWAVGLGLPVDGMFDPIVVSDAGAPA